MSESEENDADRKMAIIKKVVDELRMHFDTVQLFVTEHLNDEEGTVKWNRGSGNWLARYGQVKLWVEREEQGERLNAVKDDE